MENNSLQHHGILGQKWGVRRFQNADGTRTAAGKKRLIDSNTVLKDGYQKRSKQHEDYVKRHGINPNLEKPKHVPEPISLTSGQKKAIAYTAIGTATVAAAAYAIHKNPAAIGKIMQQVKNVKLSDVSDKALSAGKKAVTEALNGAKEGVKEGMHDAPKKAAKAVVTGVVMNQTKRALDSTVGKEESARIFQANDNKKIGKFWKTSPEDRDDDD